MLVARSCLLLCNPMDCSPPGSSVHRILQARLLEWVAILFSRSSQSTDQTCVSCISGRFFTTWATREAPLYYIILYYIILYHIGFLGIKPSTFVQISYFEWQEHWSWVAAAPLNRPAALPSLPSLLGMCHFLALTVRSLCVLFTFAAICTHTRPCSVCLIWRLYLS